MKQWWLPCARHASLRPRLQSSLLSGRPTANHLLLCRSPRHFSPSAAGPYSHCIRLHPSELRCGAVSSSLQERTSRPRGPAQARRRLARVQRRRRQRRDKRPRPLRSGQRSRSVLAGRSGGGASWRSSTRRSGRTCGSGTERAGGCGTEQARGCGIERAGGCGTAQARGCGADGVPGSCTELQGSGCGANDALGVSGIQPTNGCTDVPAAECYGPTSAWGRARGPLNVAARGSVCTIALVVTMALLLFAEVPHQLWGVLKGCSMGPLKVAAAVAAGAQGSSLGDVGSPKPCRLLAALLGMLCGDVEMPLASTEKCLQMTAEPICRRCR